VMLLTDRQTDQQSENISSFFGGSKFDDLDIFGKRITNAHLVGM